MQKTRNSAGIFVSQHRPLRGVGSFPLEHKQSKKNNINHKLKLIIPADTTKNTIDEKLFSHALHYSCGVVIGYPQKIVRPLAEKLIYVAITSRFRLMVERSNAAIY
jgi:hypothetical protein